MEFYMRHYILKSIFNMKILRAFCEMFKLYYRVEEQTVIFAQKIIIFQNIQLNRCNRKVYNK